MRASALTAEDAEKTRRARRSFSYTVAIATFESGPIFSGLSPAFAGAAAEDAEKTRRARRFYSDTVGIATFESGPILPGLSPGLHRGRRREEVFAKNRIFRLGIYISQTELIHENKTTQRISI